MKATTSSEVVISISGHFRMLFVVLYDCEGMESGDYDLTKPVYIFESSDSTYLCAFSKAEKKYVYWTMNSEQIEAAKKGKKHDILSMTSILSIRRQVQLEAESGNDVEGEPAPGLIGTIFG